MEYKLTQESIERIQQLVQEYKQREEVDIDWQEKKKKIEDLHSKNKKVGVDLTQSCYYGPKSMAELLLETEDEISIGDMDEETKILYALALDEVLGMSTKMEYNEKKNTFEAHTPRKDNKLVYDPEDIKLGIWDKILAAFGYVTEHAKKVAFAEESIENQKKQLNELKKVAVIGKKNEIVEKHREWIDKNKEIVQEEKRVEKGFYELFFGEDDVRSYKFANGKKISPVTACIAMYHQSGNRDIANMSLEELSKPENKDLQEELKRIGEEYKNFKKNEGKKTAVDKSMDHLDQFLSKETKNFTVMDYQFLNRMKTDKPFTIDYNKMEVGEDIKENNRRDQMKGAKAHVMLQVKAELKSVMGKEMCGVYGEYTNDDKKYYTAYKEVKENHLLMENIKEGKYEKIVKRAMDLNSSENTLLDGKIKSGDYNHLLEAVDQVLEQVKKPMELEEYHKEDPQIEGDGLGFGH